MVVATLVHYVCAFILKIAPGFSAPPPYRDIESFYYFYLNKKFIIKNLSFLNINHP